MKFYPSRLFVVLAWLPVAAGCGGSTYSSSSSSLPPSAGNAQVRFVDGAPTLETLVNGVPTDIGAAYLRVDGQTVTYTFTYGSISNFMPLSAGVHSMRALDTIGYFVGPLKTPSLKSGQTYTLVVVGSYPNYEVLTFEEPQNASQAQLSLYEASPAVPDADFGRFTASSHTGFTKLGSAHLGDIATVSVGKNVSDFGGYVGHGTTPLSNGALTPSQVNAFDTKNALPFHKASRFSLFLFDPKTGANGPVFGSLDP